VKWGGATAELVLSRAYEVDEATGAKVLEQLLFTMLNPGNLLRRQNCTTTGGAKNISWATASRSHRPVEPGL